MPRGPDPDPDRPSAVRPRPVRSALLHRERYRARPPEEWIEDHESAFRDFRAGYGLATGRGATP
jgi:hypothetical protein